MKKIISILGLTASLVFAAGSTNGDSSISTVLEKNCLLNSANVYNVNFGTINPIIEDGSEKSVLLWTGCRCTNGTTVTLTLTSANDWKLKKGSDFINYEVRSPSGTEVGEKVLTATGLGSAEILNDRHLFFTVTNNIKPGIYTDTITQTYNW
jgi:spore coat protein U-like protein